MNACRFLSEKVLYSISWDRAKAGNLKPQSLAIFVRRVDFKLTDKLGLRNNLLYAII